MFLGIRKKYWMLLGLAALLTGLMIFLQISPVFAVKGARVQGPFAEQFDKVSVEFIQPGKNLFRLDRKAMAEKMLGYDRVENVKISLDLPHVIAARINHFEPAALVMTDRLYGLDSHCQLIPFDTAWKEIDLPILTGLKFRRLFGAPDDYRVADVITGLSEIKDEMPDLYRQIAEINFSDHVYVSIYLTTGTDRYLASSRDFTAQLIKLDAVNRKVARSEDGCYNLVYNGVVIKQR